MKYFYLIPFFLLFTFSSFCQNQMKITLNNGEIKTGMFKMKNMSFGFPIKTKIISVKGKGKGKYKLKDIKNVIVYGQNDSLYFETILVKKYFNSNKTTKKLGQLGFNGNKIKLYYVSEILYQGGAVGNFTTVSSYHEKYLRKNNDSIAYNMGYIYGAGSKGVKKRVRDYFEDCPELIDSIDKNVIPRKETLKIALFYEENCEN